MIFLRGLLFLLPMLLSAAPAALADEPPVSVSLIADGDAEAAPPKVRWNARAVRKGAAGLWVYDTERQAPAGAEHEGLTVEMKLPVGAWEVEAVGDNGSHGRVVLEVSERLAGVTWAITDSGEPYPKEGEPTQWTLSPDTEGPILAGAPPIANSDGFRLETTGEEFRAGESRWITLVFSIPEGFEGEVEFRNADDLKGEPIERMSAAKLASQRAPMLAAPTAPGYYEIRVVDLQRRAVTRHIVHLK